MEKKDCFYMDKEKVHEIKLKLFKQSFEYHFNNCQEFKKYCELYNVKPNDIHEYSDLTKIPPIPSDVFRESKNPIISVNKREIVRNFTTSSTTSKNPAIFPFNKESLQLSNKANAKIYSDIAELDGNGSIVFLTPTPAESDTGLVSGMYFTVKNIGYEDENINFAVKSGKLDCENFIKLVEKGRKTRMLFGPPFAFIYVAEYLKNKNKTLHLDEKSKVLISGGWKGTKGLPREEFDKTIEEAFNVKRNQIRDGLGLTDIFTCLLECEYHHKHVPPWLHLSIRKPDKINEEAKEGETGLIAYMSCLINSYPAFALTGDLGTAWDRKCECGRTGQIVEHRGRASVGGQRGCAVRLEQFMVGISKKLDD
jgi:long-chain-fatty-acid---luciferin-component ligase